MLQVGGAGEAPGQEEMDKQAAEAGAGPSLSPSPVRHTANQRVHLSAAGQLEEL